VPKLKLKWAFGFPNGTSAYGQPAIAGGRLFIGSDNGFVYSLDRGDRLRVLVVSASGGVRTAISLGRAGARFAAYFGDVKANVYAVDAETGRCCGRRAAESHPLARVTGAPALYNGRLYVPVASFEEGSGPNPKYECCTFRGSVVAYDAATGEQVWKTYTIPERPRPTKKNSIGTQLYGPAGAAVWSAPTIDAKRGALYVATGDAYYVPGGRDERCRHGLRSEVRHSDVDASVHGQRRVPRRLRQRADDPRQLSGGWRSRLRLRQLADPAGPAQWQVGARHRPEVRRRVGHRSG
jgi:polyvinyl alcohol dehydrogenase (cytochrome)